MDPIATKPAWLTTEFWLTVIPSVLFLVKAFTGHDTSGVDVNGLALLAVALLSGMYAIGRSITKRALLAAQAQVLTQKLAIDHDTLEQAHAREFELQKSGLIERIRELEKPKKAAPRTARR